MSNFNGVYKGKTVLVTGHTGFKGSWLSIWLTMLGANVVGYALEPYSQRGNYKASHLEKHLFADVKGDGLKNILIKHVVTKRFGDERQQRIEKVKIRKQKNNK